jgi:hypothetical protein
VSRQWDGWQREIDLLELGLPAARCMIGENEFEDPERIVAGRAYRAIQTKLREVNQRLWAKRRPFDRISLGA